MKLLVVDDDPDLRVVITMLFEQEGHEVVEASDVASAISAFRRERPAAVLLDVNLPDGLGFDVCMRIRAESRAPILMLTVRGEEDDVVRALELGADDYLTKPFTPRMLVTRVNALLRRAGNPIAEPLAIGSIRLDATTLTLHVGTEMVHLTRLEYSLLQLLLTHPDEIVHADQLLAHIWGHRTGGDRHVLRQLVHRLRQKFGEGPDSDSSIENVPGIGYRLRPERILRRGS